MLMQLPQTSCQVTTGAFLRLGGVGGLILFNPYRAESKMGSSLQKLPCLEDVSGEKAALHHLLAISLPTLPISPSISSTVGELPVPDQTLLRLQHTAAEKPANLECWQLRCDPQAT